MKCVQHGCDKSTNDGIPVFRCNPKGAPGVWACREHREAIRRVFGGEPFDSEVDKITEIIEDDNRAT